MKTNTIICSDVIKGLETLDSDSVSLVFTSPPYNLKIDYDSVSDDSSYSEYISWLESVFKQCHRVLRKGGRCIINIDAMTNRQEDKEEEYVRPIYIDLGNKMKEIGFKFFGEHIWYKSNKDPSHNSGQWNGKKTAWGSYKSCSFPSVRRNHEYVLVFSKEQFRLEKSTDSLDSDITAEEFQNWISSTWNIQPETRNLGDHPVPFPLELPYRAVKLYSYPGDIVLDPFSGVGTTCLAAKSLNRRYIGIDISKEYCEYAESRIASENSLF